MPAERVVVFHDAEAKHPVEVDRGRALSYMPEILLRDRTSFLDYDQNAGFLILNREWVGDGLYYSVHRAVHRLNHLGLLSLALLRTPNEIPYWDVGLYAPLAFSIVPRLVWRDKPDADFANQFGRRYGILREHDFVTSINFDLITQAWVTGGVAHVAISGAMAGLLFGVLYGWLKQGGDQWSRLYVCAAILWSVPTFESDAALAVGGLIHAVVIAFAFTWLSQRWTAHRFGGGVAG